MKIDGVDRQPVRLTAPESPQRPSPAARTSAAGAETGGVERLRAALEESGANISPQRFSALVGALEELGIPLDRVDARAAVRILFLLSNSVPLSPELLAEPVAGAVPRGLVELAHAARRLLDSGGLPHNLRAALETFLRDSGFPFIADGTTAETVRTLALRSGMSFEHRLLAWFRSGADPSMLHDLARNDLKGMLLSLLNALQAAGKKSGRPPGLDDFEKSARTLVDRMTAGQIATLLENTGDRRTLAFGGAFGFSGEKTPVSVRADGGRNAKTGALDTGRFALSLDFDTPGLGRVEARLLFAGRMVSAVFVLRDERTKALAEGMVDEFRALVAGRGYEPVSIRFAVDGDEKAPAPDPPGRHPVDVRG